MSFYKVEGDSQQDAQTSRTSEDANQPPVAPKLQIWANFGHQFEAGELEILKRSIVEMALSRIDGQEELYVGG